MTLVIGTAGHIDHGKTTMLRALTGIDADRLPEEQARGMTIDVGYAHLVLDNGIVLDFVDVPGHDRLVGNMLVGAGEIDAAMVVVAADDGPRAQTLEHLELLDGLGIAAGIAVVTKIDAVDERRVDEVVAAVRALLAPTSMAGVPILAVSATSGAGLAELRAALVALRDRRSVDQAGSNDPGRPSRLAIDRIFTVRGRGTVVTGTLRGSPLERGALLRVAPGDGRPVRAREIQVHGRTVERAERGRVALNLVGIEDAGLARGSVLTTDSAIVASDRLLVALRPSVALRGEAGRPPADRTRVHVHLGTARVEGVVGRAGRDAADLPDGEVSAILRLAQPIAVAPGDRFVLRRPSPPQTVAGGRVLDPRPPRGVSRRRATPDRLQALAAATDAKAGGRQWAAARLDLHGLIAEGDVRLATDVGAAVDAAIVEVVRTRSELRQAEVAAVVGRVARRAVSLTTVAPASAATGGARAGTTRATGREVETRLAAMAVERLVASGILARDGDRLRQAGTLAPEPSADLVDAMDRLVVALSVVAPPSLAEAARSAGCSAVGIREAERTNRIVRLDDDLAWAFPIYTELVERAVAMASVAPLTPAAFRDATGTSRKYVMSILEDLDRRAILRRTVAGHIPGPRAAWATAGSGG